MVIISISMGIVGVMVSKGRGNIKIKSFSQDITATIRYARNHAASEKKKYSFFMREKKYDLYKDLSGIGEMDLFEPVISREVPEGLLVRFKGDEEDYYRIDFYPAGSSTGGMLDVIDDKGRNFRITVNRITGKVRIKKDGAQD